MEIDFKDYYPNLDANKLKEVLNDVLVKETTELKREFVIYTNSEEFVKEFDKAMKKEVNKLYGKGKGSK